MPMLAFSTFLRPGHCRVDLACCLRDPFLRSQQLAWLSPVLLGKVIDVPANLQIALLIPCLLFLALRGITGCLAIYPSHEQYWVEDYLYYSMDTFPEFLNLVILCWPTLLARMGQAYPRATDPKGQEKAKKGELAPEEMSTGQHGEPPGHVLSNGSGKGEHLDQVL